MCYTRYVNKILLLIFILSVLFNVVGCQKNESKNSFNFVFMTDIHIQPELNADEGFKKAIEKINDLNPDFVITGGDLIMDALGESFDRSIEQFELYLQISERINAPVHNVIGNHEIFGIYKNSGIDVMHPEYGKLMYKNMIADGETYYSFDYKNWHFILLDVISITDDNKYIGKVDSVQFEWIKNDIKYLNKNTPIAIVGHIPFVTFADQILEEYPAELSPSLVVTNAYEILNLFEGYNLKLMLQGHLHLVEEMIFKDIHFITGGAVSGNKWEGPSHGFEEGFLSFKMENDDFSWEYINIEF